MSAKTYEFPDLEQIVKNWAWREYERTATKKQMQLLNKQRKKEQNYLSLTIDWSEVRFHDETVWPRISEDIFADDTGEDRNANVESKDEAAKAEQGHTKMSVLFRTKFTNDTDQGQEYTMKTEKTTRSSMTTEIESGFTKGFEMSVKLAAPGEVFEANAGYSREFSLVNIEGETQEEEVTWGVESTIHVKQQHMAEAQLVVNEKKMMGNFEIISKIRGNVYVTFNNIKDNNSLVKATGHDIADIVSKYLEMERRKGIALDYINVNEDSSTITVKTKGTCKFRFGVKQEVLVKQIPI